MILLRVVFLLDCECANGLLTFTKCLGKIWILSYGPKISRSIRMWDSLNHSVSQTSSDMKLDFCMWLDMHRSNKFTQSFKWVWSDVPGHAQSYVK